jgi:hypothetical protein
LLEGFAIPLWSGNSEAFAWKSIRNPGKNKRSSEKKMSVAIHDILSENGYPQDKINEITMQIIDLAKRDL